MKLERKQIQDTIQWGFQHGKWWYPAITVNPKEKIAANPTKWNKWISIN